MQWWERKDGKYWQQNQYRWIRDNSVGEIFISKSDGVRQRNFLSPSHSFSSHTSLSLFMSCSQFPANNPSYPLCSIFCTTLPVYSTPLHSTPLHSTPLYSTLLHSTLLYSTLLYSTLLYSTPLHSTPLYSTLLYSTLLYSISLSLYLIPTSFNALHFPSLYPILFTSLHFLYLLWGRVLRQVWQCRCYTCSSP